MTDSQKPWWKSNVMQVVIIFLFIPAAILYATGDIASDDGQALLFVLSTGVGIYLGRDQGTKWANAFLNKESQHE